MAKVYLSSPVKSIVEVVTEDVSTESEELSKMSSDQISALSEKTGIDITSDSALAEAKAVVMESIETMTATARSIAGKVWDTLAPITELIDSVSSVIPGVSELMDSLEAGTTLKSYQDTATLLCDGISFDDLNLDFLSNKIGFEELLKWALDNKYLDFISQMMDCSLFDEQSVSNIKTHIDDIKNAGDVGVFKTILPALGVETIANKKSLCSTLVSNMSDNVSNVSDVKSIMSSLSVTPSSLVTNTTMGTTSLDLNSITNLSKNGNSFIDDTISSSTRKIASVVSSMF